LGSDLKVFRRSDLVAHLVFGAFPEAARPDILRRVAAMYADGATCPRSLRKQSGIDKIVVAWFRNAQGNIEAVLETYRVGAEPIARTRCRPCRRIAAAHCTRRATQVKNLAGFHRNACALVVALHKAAAGAFPGPVAALDSEIL
jgi:hypothetical protein